LLLQRSAQADPGEDSHDDDNEPYDVDDGVHLGDPCDALMVLDNCEQGTLVAAAAQKSCSADARSGGEPSNAMRRPLHYRALIEAQGTSGSSLPPEHNCSAFAPICTGVWW
jgi:hypothetical protein